MNIYKYKYILYINIKINTLYVLYAFFLIECTLYFIYNIKITFSYAESCVLRHLPLVYIYIEFKQIIF